MDAAGQSPENPMPRTFAYVRVSTVGQTVENQIGEIAVAGFAVEPHRIVSGTVSGSEAIARRREFARLLDRLGRDAMGVATTVAQLDGMGVWGHCLALGGVDLTSSAGRMTMGVINAVTQFERDLLIERTQSGLARARAEGKRLGRPHSLSDATRAAVRDGLKAVESVSALAQTHGTSLQTILRIRHASEAGGSGRGGHAFSTPSRVSATPRPYAARLDGSLKRQGIRSSMPLCGWPSRIARRVAAR